MNIDTLFKVKYVGKEPSLVGHTALARWTGLGSGSQFVVQVDELSHPMAHGWHEARRADWLHQGRGAERQVRP